MGCLLENPGVEFELRTHMLMIVCVSVHARVCMCLCLHVCVCARQRPCVCPCACIINMRHQINVSRRPCRADLLPYSGAQEVSLNVGGWWPWTRRAAAPRWLLIGAAVQLTCALIGPAG